VTYLEPIAGNEQAAGFDLASDPDRRTALDRAIAGGSVTATAPIRLVQERGSETGILLIDAVPESPTGPGIVLIALRMGTFTQALADPLVHTLSLKLADAGGAPPFFDSVGESQMPTYEAGFDFGGRRYEVLTAPSPGYLALHRGWQSWAVLAAGALGTGLLGGLLLLGTGHTYRLEELACRLGESESRIAADLADMTRLNQLSNRLVREGGAVDRCLNEVLDTAIAISGADKGNVQLIDQSSDALTIAVQRGFQEPFLTFFESVRDEAAACTAAMRSGERVIVEDVTVSDIFLGQPSQTVLLDAGVRAVISTPLSSSTGNLLGMVSTHFGRPHRPSERQLRLLDLLARQTADYLERKRAEEIEGTLIREIQHRSNNLLAVIQAIAHRSLAGDGPLPQARKAFEARLQALARANRQLTKSSWSGVNLAEIVRVELEPFAGRTVIDGINVKLGPQYAQSFSLALHELATNAAKYGALSNVSGKVGVSWTIVSEGRSSLLTFKWQESGGPPVTAPTRHGFGTSLVKATFKDARFDYAPDGLSCEIEVLLGRVGPAAADAGPQALALGGTEA
jgi:two-component sensor histidine kinase